MQRDIKTHAQSHTCRCVWLAGWLALPPGLGLAFSYITLQRTEAQITGKANTGLWGMCTSLCTCCRSMLFLYNQSECPTRSSLWMRLLLGSDFIIQFNTQFQGCLYSWHLADVFVPELHASVHISCYSGSTCLINGLQYATVGLQYC